MTMHGFGDALVYKDLIISTIVDRKADRQPNQGL